MPLPLATRVSRLAIQMKILATDADDGFSLGDDGEGKKKSEEAKNAEILTLITAATMSAIYAHTKNCHN